MKDAEDLKGRLGKLAITPKAMVGGASELIEEVASKKISGEEDRYSKTDLSDFQANLDGAQKIVSLLHKDIAARDPELLKRIETNFAKADTSLAKVQGCRRRIRELRRGQAGRQDGDERPDHRSGGRSLEAAWHIGHQLIGTHMADERGHNGTDGHLPVLGERDGPIPPRSSARRRRRLRGSVAARHTGCCPRCKVDARSSIAIDSLAADHSHDDAPHDFDNDGTREAQPFHGPHQAGIVNPQPAAAIFAAFDVLATDRADLERLFRELTQHGAFLTRGGELSPGNPKMPPADNGVLGPDVFPDNLTMTVALGASLFDERFGLADQKPKHLVRMEQFPNDALDASFCHGDLLIQFCSNTAETNLHALRQILRATPDLLSIRWKMDGFLPPHTLKKLGKDTVRNLLGFKDGTANLVASDKAVMDDLVWVGPGSQEPAWTQGGTYMVARMIRMTVERWDRTPLGEQQTIIGRSKMSGAPLGMANEHDLPRYTPDAQGETIPVDAHIRLANPRTPQTQANLILRRPYNYSRDAVTKAGQLDMGLAFVCFQADIDKGFKAVQARLNGEPLEEYIKPFGGGYFFVLPGVRDADDYLAKGLVDRSPA